MVGLKKPRWLKTSFLLAVFSHAICVFYKNMIGFKKGNAKAVLIISTDGLGDAFLRLSMVGSIINKHKKLNQDIYILSKDFTRDIYKALPLNFISYRDQHKTNPIKRFAMAVQLNQIGFDVVYVLDFICNENLFSLVHSDKKIGFRHRSDHRHDELLTDVSPLVEYVGDAIDHFCEKNSLGGKEMDNRPFFNFADAATTQANQQIVLAIGASNRARMMRKSNMQQIVSALLTKYSGQQIIMVGYGNREQEYADWLYEKINSERLINLVGKLTLMQLINHVCECGLLIGFDSGLYNLAFTMRKPTLCLAADNHLVLHNKPWVNIVHGNKKVYGMDDGLGCDKTNSITPQQVLTACLHLMTCKITSAHLELEPAIFDENINNQ